MYCSPKCIKSYQSLDTNSLDKTYNLSESYYSNHKGECNEYKFGYYSHRILQDNSMHKDFSQL